ncbi:hypothetical protein [Methylobacterium sp. JK268]
MSRSRLDRDEALLDPAGRQRASGGSDGLTAALHLNLLARATRDVGAAWMPEEVRLGEGGVFSLHLLRSM